ncbi:hypothetical protein AnigIFM60653_000829 [Aspergillus niger]|nr:hypothetical protein AnigIFM60653_000829 [Aspergillus niger]
MSTVSQIPDSASKHYTSRADTISRLSERVELTQISALESSMREQKQWNRDIEETVDKLQKSSFGSGATNVTTRGKDTSS